MLRPLANLQRKLTLSAMLVSALAVNASASAGPPTVVSVTPNSGAAASQTFTAVYSYPNGVADLAAVRILFNATATDACYVAYFPPTNGLGAPTLVSVSPSSGAGK